LSFSLVQGSLNGFCFQYFWPDLIDWNDKTIAFFTPFSTASVLAFSLAFLGLKRTKSEHLLKTLLAAACIACVAVFFVPYSVMIKVVIVLTLISMASVFTIAILQWKSGNSAARYFTLAWVVLISSILSYGLNKLGILPRNFVTENMLQIGSILEVILLSFALADRVNFERRAKIEAQKLATEISVIAKNERLVSEKIVHDSYENVIAAHQVSVEAKIESKAKSQFLATMSHEIRTPMNGVIGITELLQHTSLDAQQRGFLDIIKNSGQSLLTIINDILDYSKIVAGEMTLEKIDIDLEVMVNECSELFSIMAEKKQIKVGAIIEPGTSLKIHTDPVRLRQIITNLMGNAIKFTETGYVLLKVKQISSSLEETCLRFEISDTGIGIEKSVQEHLFSEFKQADASTTRKFGGTGLGLSICKRLVMLMDGNIGIESQLGNGACFWFNLNFPIHEKPQRLSAIDSDHRLQGKKILLISEDLLFRFLTDNVYHRWGITFNNITSFDSLVSRKEELKQVQFDVILWDEKLFFDHRYAAMREISDEFDTQKTAFCLMTGLNCKWQINELAAVHMSSTMRYPTTAVDIKNQLTDLFLNTDISKKSTTDNKYENFSTTRVLVAEDNPVNQIVIKGMLEKFSIYPDFADNGLEAVDKFTTSTYDIVFMDCEMPEMDGLEATLRMRQWEGEHKKHPTPIVALTAHALKEHRDKAIHVGMDYFMVKPVSLDNVQHLLTEILNKRYSETA
jgi:signal transduction histidine kinase/CheY-like chemotaxis protein